jgi:DNA-3-methyladenine glycosylase II
VKPAYWDHARRTLLRRDATLAAIIRRYPRVSLATRGDPFATLARSIVGQQISVRAADAVWGRLVGACPELTPARLSRLRPTTLRRCGLSARKVEYLRDLAAHFRSGRIDPDRFASLDDEAVIAELTDVRGIGRWTVEMFLIFNLLRPDVLPLDDIGLLKAVGLHYLGGATAQQLLRGDGRRQVIAIAEAWAPWRSVATWYLWRSLDPVPVEY